MKPHSQLFANAQFTDAQVKQFCGYFMLAMLCSLCLMVPDANAQSSVVKAGRAVYTEIYTWVGIIGGIVILLTGINWALGDKLGTGRPAQWFFGAIVGTAIGFGSPDLVMLIKSLFSTSPGQV